jgi:hypothetical protein
MKNAPVPGGGAQILWQVVLLGVFLIGEIWIPMKGDLPSPDEKRGCEAYG